MSSIRPTAVSLEAVERIVLDLRERANPEADHYRAALRDVLREVRNLEPTDSGDER